MRGVGFGLGVVLFVNSFAVLADDSNQSGYATSFGVGTGGGLSFKMVSGDTDQIFAGFNLGLGQYKHQSSTSTSTTSTSSTDNNNTHGYSVFVGIRHFLEKEKSLKFLQLSISGGRNISNGSGHTSKTNAANILLGYGIEHFFVSNLSIEALAGLNYSYSKLISDTNGISQYNSTNKSLYFPAVGTAINYYW